MIFFKPENILKNSGECRAFDEQNNCLGFCTFTFQGYEMKITELNCEDETIKEGLLRSALNLCANRNVFICYIPRELLSLASKKLGFGESKLKVEIPDALAGSCGGCLGKME